MTERPALGVVATNGGTYFTNADINECRAFLREHGLENHRFGWADEKGVYSGMICYDGTIDRDGNSTGTATWTAAYWRN